MPKTTKNQAAQIPHQGMSFLGFVIMIGAFMAINSLNMDVMLPALPQIGTTLHLENPNHAQLIITAYLIGLGLSSLIIGPISDWLGRKPILLFGLSIFTVGTIAAAVSTSFEVMLGARLLQGIGAAAPRVMAFSIVRDWYHGRQMGRVMSLTMVVLMICPVIAPSMGQAVLFLADWEWIFHLLTLFAVTMICLSYFKLPESLPVEQRRGFTVPSLLDAYKSVLKTRVTLGYMVALTLVFAQLFAFLNSAEQIFADIFDRHESFPLYFASMAVFMSIAAFLNASLVEKYGLRRLSHIALLGFIGANMLSAILSLTGSTTLVTFVVIQGVVYFFFGSIAPNFNTLAMDPLGKLAGAGSAMINFFTIFMAAVLGAIVGALYNETLVPYAVGCFIYSLLAILTVLITEKGRLFQSETAPPSA